jgi:RNA polymerase sigma-54 factor
MELHIEPYPEPRQAIGISHRQIVAVRLLQMPSQELMGAIAYERDINPAIELMERESCNYCGAGVDAGAHACPLCGMSLLGVDSRHRDHEDYALERSVGTAIIGTPIEDDGSDPMVRVAGTVERGDGLLQMLNLMITEDESEIAEYLVGNLDHHGYLVDNIVEDAANELSCRRERIEHVLHLLQRLDPPGIGARGAQECLLIQLQRLAQAGKPRKLAELLVRNHLPALAFRRFREVAHVVGRTPKTVEAE